MKEGRPACVLLYTLTGADLYTISESTQAAEAGRDAGGVSGDRAGDHFILTSNKAAI